jgi:hypothetical protein
MTSLFKRLFGFRKTPASAPTVTTSGRGDAQPSRFGDRPTTGEDKSELGMRSQLIHVVLRSALRRHGLPSNWIECQVLQDSSRRSGAGLSVRLIVRHWDDRLMQHLLAFERAFRTDVERYEPSASQWLHGISWNIQPINECPHKEMPDKSFWLSTPLLKQVDEPMPLTARAEESRPAAKLKFEATRSSEDAREQALNTMQRLFDVRDQEIAQAGKNVGQPEFAPTEPLILHRQ